MNQITQSQVNNLKLKPGQVYNPTAEFSTYMLNFYGKGGLYDMNMTADEVLQGTVQYIQSGREFEGDSVDREAIRDIILANRGE